MSLRLDLSLENPRLSVHEGLRVGLSLESRRPSPKEGSAKERYSENIATERDAGPHLCSRAQPRKIFTDKLLAQAEGPGLRLSIRNRSALSQAYLYDPALQPSLLLIRGEGGKRYAPRDDRGIKKQNHTPEAEDYRTLAPGATDSLLTADFESGSEGYSLKWGPYLYRGLPPGRYKVRAEWRTARDAWVDPETGKRGKISGVWKGNAESNEAVVVLP